MATSRSSRRQFKTISRSVAAVLAIAVLAGACGGSGSKTKSTTATSAATTATSADSAFQAVIDKAKQEGSVTIYSSQGTDQLNDVAKRFQAKYGVKVEVLRDVDANLEAKLNVEHDSKKGIADVAAISDTAFVNDKGKAGYFVAPAGPDFNNPAYDKAKNINATGSFVTSSAVFTIGWNTSSLPSGIKSYSDLLDPKLKGKLGVPDPAVSPSVVDFYFYLQEQNGADFVQKLAAQKPQIFPSVLTAAQNLTSGQISAATAVQALVDEKTTGAPVDFTVPSPAWGARFWTSVTAVAPHPNAAQLLADYLVTQDGQEAIARKAGSALPNIKGAVIDVSKVRVPDPAKLTPEAVASFRAEFKKLFT
jgi:iron(III) transport system substrate-binding protein